MARPDLTGQRFGRWLVLEQSSDRRWFCRCDCGTGRVVHGQSLRRGLSRSCGCGSAESSRTRNRLLALKHGRVDSPEYRAWRDAKSRCFNEHHRAYGWYGARGIAMCAKWRDSFAAFLADMGPKPSPAHSLDRIDNDGHYEPGNCRWATTAEQAENRRPRRPALANKGD